MNEHAQFSSLGNILRFSTITHFFSLMTRSRQNETLVQPHSIEHWRCSVCGNNDPSFSIMEGNKWSVPSCPMCHLAHTLPYACALPVKETNNQNLANIIYRCFKPDLISQTQNSKLIPSDINALLSWSVLWDLKFNVAKCCIWHFRCSNVKANYKIDSLNLNKRHQ